MKTSITSDILIPNFLYIDFTGSKKEIDIRNFTSKFYDNKCLDILVSLFRYLDPKFNYVVEHNYKDYYYDRFNPNIDFLSNKEVIEYHLLIDCSLISRFSYEIEKLQTELNTILKGIESANDLNKRIAKFYEESSDLDVQEIWHYHDSLYTKYKDQLITEKINNETENIDMSNLAFKLEAPIDDVEMENYYKDFYKELLVLIHQREKVDNRYNNFPSFDLVKYKELLRIQDSPLINNKQNLIAGFAGESTLLLQERLKEIHFQIKGPLQDPETRSWNYAIDYTSNFLGLIYGEFLQYVNSTLKGLGFIPRCGWCQHPIQPTGQQKRRLKENKEIYCREGYENCKRKGKTKNQNEKRVKQIQS